MKIPEHILQAAAAHAQLTSSLHFQPQTISTTQLQNYPLVPTNHKKQIPLGIHSGVNNSTLKFDYHQLNSLSSSLNADLAHHL
jgi:hypothetical protein